MIIKAIFLVLGAIFFMAGLHSIDNGWNLRYIQQTNSEWVDTNIAGNSFTPKQLYNNGIFLVISGFIISIMSAMSIEKERYAPKKMKIKLDSYDDNL